MIVTVDKAFCTQGFDLFYGVTAFLVSVVSVKIGRITFRVSCVALSISDNVIIARIISGWK